ncbi:MAG TPA: hypothetical protein VGU20_16080 [Stellaceae bacterium]|nr:hypothetical protein [Stellaceae bacterium]
MVIAATMRGVGSTVKPMLLVGSQNDVVRKNDSHRALGRIFRRLIRVVPPPCGNSSPITFDRRETGRFRRLEGGKDVRRSFVRVESGVVHEVLEPPVN